MVEWVLFVNCKLLNDCIVFFRMVHFSCIVTMILGMFIYSEAGIAKITCDKKGYSVSTLYWDCQLDGTIRCSNDRQDCSSCERYGKLTTGYDLYTPSGEEYTVGGGGWDCRRKCTRCLGCSGKEDGGVAEINCDYFNYSFF